jgi:hypothetical protein
LLISILLAFGCANELNLIPEGYKDLVKDHDFIAKMAAGVDFPVVVNVEANAQEFPVVFTKNGRLVKDKPFWIKVTDYQFALIASGVPDALCYTNGWMPVGAGDTGSIPCRVDTKEYIGIPLTGILEFRFDGDSTVHEVVRAYYLVHKK